MRYRDMELVFTIPLQVVQGLSVSRGLSEVSGGGFGRLPGLASANIFTIKTIYYSVCKCSLTCLEGTEHGEEDDGDEDEDRKLVIPAVEHVTAGIAVMFEIGEQLATVEVINNQ